MTHPLSALTVGSRWHHKSYGDEVFTIVKAPIDGNIYVRYEKDTDDTGHPWPTGALTEFGTPFVPEAPARPLVDFSGTARKTAREYAKVADSRILRVESRAVLHAAARGEKVDAYDLNEAVLDAMRSATTRLGQSTARRGLATKIAYLGHITQAVLENHADSLPAYAEGDRSRAVEEAKAALREAAKEIERVTQAYEDLKSSANEEIDNRKAEHLSQVTTLTADLSIVRDNYEKLSDQNAGLRQALKYAANLLREAGVEGGDQRLQGFVDAVLEVNQQA